MTDPITPPAREETEGMERDGASLETPAVSGLQAAEALKQEKLKRRHQHHLATLKIVGIYALFGSLWIYLSDTLLGWIVRDPKVMTQIAVFKGLAFIVLTAILLYVLVNRYVQQYWHAEEALREQESHLQEAQRIAHLGSWMRDLVADELRWSDETYRIFGWPKDKALNFDGFMQCVHPEDLPRIRQLYSKAREDREPIDIEYRIVRGDGEIRFLHGRSAAEYDNDGRLIKLKGIVMDITGRKQVEEDRQRLFEQTQRDAQTKAELLNEVNHRVKNNLVSILGLLLAEKRNAPAEGRSYVEVSMDNLAHRIEGLIKVHQMLSESQWAPMRVNTLAECFINAASGAIAVDQQLKLDIKPSEIEVSPRQASNLALVFNELVTNSVKYALPGRSCVNVAFRVWKEGGMIGMEYRDDGPGYPPEVISLERQNGGMRLIHKTVTLSLRGHLTLANENGAVTTMLIKMEEKRRT